MSYRDRRWEIRLSESELRELDRRARSLGLNRADYFRRMALGDRSA